MIVVLPRRFAKFGRKLSKWLKHPVAVAAVKAGSFPSGAAVDSALAVTCCLATRKEWNKPPRDPTVVYF